MDKTERSKVRLQCLLDRVRVDLKQESAPILSEVFPNIESALADNKICDAIGGFDAICRAYDRARDYEYTINYIKETLREVYNYV